MKKFYRDLFDIMSRYGFQERRRSGKHIIWTNPKGKVITTSTSPSCPRALKNIESMARGLSRTDSLEK